ncbi:MAG TPA: thioesterase family protein [Phycisphaerales bacterium]|nr:thioesterase family protein [Phycisphaerales bacterium]
MREHSFTIRVRYAECDPMGVAHHSVYPVWFEMGRTELLRSSGFSYREMESQKLYMVVIDLHVKYRKPALYDDLLTLTTTLAESSRVKLTHHYELKRGEETLAVADITLACVDASGRARELPAILQQSHATA